MDELVAKRWTKSGKDRLYVNRVGPRGPAVAWLDLETGETKIADPAYARLARQVIEQWLQSHGTKPSPAASPRRSIPASIPPLPPLTMANDLALNLPGAAVKDKVRELEAGRSALVRWVARTLNLSVRGTETWQAGLVGEEIVGETLAKLRDQGWYVLHAIRWPSGADIDHLVIGPPGVFTVNAKHHAGARVWVGEKALRVNNKTTDHVRFSRAEAERVRKLLHHWCGWAVPVQPVLAIVGAESIAHASDSAPPVMVVAGTEVDQRLAVLPSVIPSHRTASVFEVARRRDVWLSLGR